MNGSVLQQRPIQYTRSKTWRATAANASSMTEGETSEVETDTWISAQELSTQSSSWETVMDVEQIMKILPHRYPFLLLDRVIAYEPGKRAIAVKNISMNEPQFTGHFPDRPIMPGVLQVEALAQCGGIVMLQPPFTDPTKKQDFFFGGVDGVKWRMPLTPGDTLVMEMTLKAFKERFGIAKMEGKYELWTSIRVFFCLFCFAI